MKYYKEIFNVPSTGEKETMYWQTDKNLTLRIHESDSEYGWEIFNTKSLNYTDFEESIEIEKEEFESANKRIIERIMNR